MKVSVERRAFAKEASSRALPVTAVAPGGSFFSEPGRTNARTRWPRAVSSGINRLPMYPVPPVMKMSRGMGDVWLGGKFLQEILIESAPGAS